MAGLVILFIIAMAVFLLQLRQTQAELEDTVQGIRDALTIRNEILEKLKTELEKEGLQVTVLNDQGVLRLPEEGIRFNSGDVDPTDADRPSVGKLAQVLAQVLPAYVSKFGALDSSEVDAVAVEDPENPVDLSYCSSPSVSLDEVAPETSLQSRLETVLIEGHTDETRVAEGNRFQNNLELSGMRASRIYRMLTRCEPVLLQLQNVSGEPILGASGYGETRLVNQDEQASVDNRRIDLRFLMNLPLEILEASETVGGEVEEGLNRD